MITAKIIADSISEEGHRLTTFEAIYPRFIHSEIMTHRTLSRNTASSRARPLRKVIEDIATNPAIPVVWASEQSGMSGGDEISNTWEAEKVWLDARDAAIRHAEMLGRMNVHKSIVNRILEPFSLHTAILTGTSFENFFALRANSLAQPEFQELAYTMKNVYKSSEPTELKPGEWHLPYLRDDDPQMNIKDQIEVSVARCARVSYLTHDGVRDIEKDKVLYNRLIEASPPHASPLEHIATPWAWNANEIDRRRGLGVRPRIGNLIGWRTHRLDLEARNKINSYR